ncbi:hypothetical protein IWQ60_011374 [Tieghemiomyces parasiticus]|uniref:Calnexin n=1 Tax=Tieghemiomyces parasiticus TaxID=78921 RepID=A0A9W7ZHA6_9FUNG|nr:hypothetical protein IWQ60_011374 [Tieghemiomyces parasiticus]
MQYNLLALAALVAVAASHVEKANDAKSDVDMGDFKPITMQGFFLEQFVTPEFGRWVPSKATKKEDGKPEPVPYQGIWRIQEPEKTPFIRGDHGLVLTSAAAHHAISVPFEKPLVPGDKPLVVQYEVKFQNSLKCGGAYIKLISQEDGGEAFDPAHFNDKTPYTVMFGPDRCGSETDKIHFIVRHKNPKTGEIVEKHLTSPPKSSVAATTVLYTLIVNPDESYEIRVDNATVKSGSLLTDFDPPFNPPQEISDPDDKMPDDWVLEAEIPDPKATKPADWDEDAPKRIPDPEATKPADWLDDEPLEIPDPEDTAPAEWDDEMDGDYVPRLISNPKCQEAAGCGKWERPLIVNPAYKGKWKAPLVANPSYKGVWQARKIPNPGYFEDKHPSAMTPIVGAGFELLAIENMILFDNIYVGQSVAEAERLAEETWKVKKEAETAQLFRPEEGGDAADAEVPDPRDFVKFARYQVTKFRDDVSILIQAGRVDIGRAIRDQPRVAGILGLLFVATAWILNFILVALMPKQATAKVQEVKQVAQEKADQLKAQAEKAAAAASSALAEKKEAVRRKVTEIADEEDDDE